MILQTFLSFLLFFVPNKSATLELEIENIKTSKGKIWLAVYRPDEEFGEGGSGIYKIITVKDLKNIVVKFSIDPGEYAVALYHDINNNEKLDKNFVGFPKEPFGFSKDFRPKFSAPKFSDCSFVVPEIGRKMKIKLTN